MERKVAIIGAGVSGILACKYALSKGYSPVVFEAKSSIGGVWINTIETTKLQSPGIFYQFSDFPWPKSVTKDYPTNQEVRKYLESYANHFGLFKHIKFNRKVTCLKYDGASESEIQSWSLWGGTGEAFSSKGKWDLMVQDTRNLSSEEYQFEFVILCIGRFSDVPNIPEFLPGKGQEVFKGKVMHSMEFSNMDNQSAAEFIKGKRIVVVGLGKSAMDIAVECSTANGVENPCTMIYRKERWTVPDNLPLLRFIPFVLFNRFGELSIRNKPGQGLLLGLLAIIFSILRCAIVRFLEIYVSKMLDLPKYKMVPNHSIMNQISSCELHTLPKGFFNRVDEGSIKLVKTQDFSFCEDGILIGGEGQPIQTDLVILCTGYRGVDKIKDIFVSPFFRKCIGGSRDKPHPMYREVIQPRIPQLAIVGLLDSHSSLFTAEMMSRWLVELFDGTFKVPNINDMEKNIAEWDNCMKQYTSGTNTGCIGTLHIWYSDQLCRDMGWNPKRKKGFLSELFEPYGPWDYVYP